MRIQALIAAFLGLLPTVVPASVPRVVCSSGRFAVAGGPLLNGSVGTDEVVFTGTQVSTASGCPLTAARTRVTARGTRLTVRWSACGAVTGVRFTALIDAAGCAAMQGRLRARQPRVSRLFTAARVTGTCTDTSSDTFAVIQQRIFDAYGCAVSSCHGPFAQGSLDLRDGASYGQLVGVTAANAAAAAARKQRVSAGDVAASFLSQKLHGTLGAGEGTQMPLVGSRLSATELALVDAWIAAGAPQTGHVAGAPCLPALEYRPPDPPPVPAGGYQVVLDGPVLQPGQETEFCYWVPTPNTADFTVGKWEYVLNPGTHHFAIYENRDDVPNPPANSFLYNDFGCFQEASYGASLSGAPQAPYYVDAYPAGVARVMRGAKYLGLNAHYHNDYEVPIQVKVWVNIHPFQGAPQHLLQTLTSLDTTFGIDVPAFSQVVRHGRFVNGLGRPMSFVNLSGHMHKRGLRFTARKSDGTVLYDNFDWAHPLQIAYAPPLVLAPGDWIDYECLHDNGVTRPVKRDAAGNPIAVKFGVTTDDEMCILPGAYYTD